VSIYSGFRIYPNAFIKEDHFTPRELARSISAPVLWRGQPVPLYFNSCPNEEDNLTASGLIRHPGFVIRGDAVVVTAESLWHHAQVPGRDCRVSQQIEDLSFKDGVILRTSGLWYTHTNVYAKDRDDFLYLKLVLHSSPLTNSPR